jgi:hypothetical protein
LSGLQQLIWASNCGFLYVLVYITSLWVPGYVNYESIRNILNPQRALISVTEWKLSWSHEILSQRWIWERERERGMPVPVPKSSFFWGKDLFVFSLSDPTLINSMHESMTCLLWFCCWWWFFGTRSTKSWKSCPRDFRSWNPPPNWSHFVTRFCVIMGPNVTCAAGFWWLVWLAVSSSLDSSSSWSCSRTSTSLKFEGEPDLLNVIEDH